MEPLIFCFLILYSSLFIATFSGATKTQRGFTIDLIHRDSPLSPFYNPSLTPTQLIKSAASRSISRSNRVSLLVDENKLPNTIVTPDEFFGEYLMRYYIGTPPVERFAIADTGSDLIWVQCSPCKKCNPQKPPLFDPKKSSTFRTVPCDSQPCTLLHKNQRICGTSGQCVYGYSYGDKSFTIGQLGVDLINFSSNKNATFHHLTFGCGFLNKETAATDTRMSQNTGLVGLGAGPLSLTSQLGDEIGRKFSYCLVPFGSNFTSKLKFGSESMENVKGVVSTPLIIKSNTPTYYYLNLEGISVGMKMVKPSKNSATNDYGNIIIDSGTAYTNFEESFYNEFVTLVKEVLGVKVAKENPTNTICFKYYAKNNAFPKFVFHFTGAMVSMNRDNLFYYDHDENLLCLLMKTTKFGVPILGHQAQVGFRVEYDLQGGKVSFAPTDCTKN
ncbi:hypothetical protein VNO78_13250 [Psophocarpus tetragonolobus]|uniref:Peptidase A1 domain-containing protein n=1 Tax=Psophocarpus tetragonolobus TaxID=3891 RepID=A0AAN9SQ60_PSOTE